MNISIQYFVLLHCMCNNEHLKKSCPDSDTLYVCDISLTKKCCTPWKNRKMWIMSIFLILKVLNIHTVIIILMMFSISSKSNSMAKISSLKANFEKWRYYFFTYDSIGLVPLQSLLIYFFNQFKILIFKFLNLWDFYFLTIYRCRRFFTRSVR